MGIREKINNLLFATALAVLSMPAITAAKDTTFEKAWMLFNQSQNNESLALCKELLTKYPADPENTPQILLLEALNYDHLANASRKKEDEMSAKIAAEKIIKDYPASDSAAEAYFYLGEIYSGNVPVKIETDCAKALPMYIEAIRKAKKQWVRDSSYSGIDRCKIKPLSDTAQTLVDIKEYELALPIYLKIVDKYPKSQSGQYAQMMLGICYDALGKLDKAIEAYETCLKTYTPYKGDSLFYYYAKTLQKAARYDEARDNYNKVINDPKSYPWAVEASKSALAQIDGKNKASTEWKK